MHTLEGVVYGLQFKSFSSLFLCFKAVSRGFHKQKVFVTEWYHGGYQQSDLFKMIYMQYVSAVNPKILGWSHDFIPKINQYSFHVMLFFWNSQNNQSLETTYTVTSMCASR